MCGGGRGEGAHCPPRREVLGLSHIMLSVAQAEDGMSRPWHFLPWPGSRQYLGFGEPMWGSLAPSASAPARQTAPGPLAVSHPLVCFRPGASVIFSLPMHSQPGLQEGVPQAPDDGDQRPACYPPAQPLIPQGYAEPCCLDGHQWAHSDRLLPPLEQLEVTSLHLRPRQPHIEMGLLNPTQ